MKRISAAFLTIAAAVSFVAGPAGATTSSETYTGGLIGDGVNRCRQDNAAGLNIAAACLAMSGGQTVTVKVNDDLLDNVDFFYIFENAAGDCVGQPDDPTAACPNDGFAVDHMTKTAPPGTARLKILLSGPVFAALDDANTATTGTVVFTK